MKITREEFENGTEGPANPLDLFWQGIRSEATKKYYTQMLRRILCDILEDVLEGTFEQRAGQFVRMVSDEPDRALSLLLQISKKLRGRTELPHGHADYMNPSSMKGYFKPVKKLLDMNDVSMKWKRVYATLPELDNVSESRGWERREIALMLRHAKSMRNRAIMLVAASSGIRLGGFESLRWSDLRPLYRGADGRIGLGGGGDDDDDDGGGGGGGRRGAPACAMLTVYARTSASYPAFITPEAYAAVTEYRDGVWARDVGRPPRPHEPIFKKGGAGKPAAIGTYAIGMNVVRMARAAGLRVPGRKLNKRFDVPVMNGFRRFWNKACKESASGDSSLAALIKKEYMMGHVGLVSLDRSYFKTHVTELAEEYALSVPALTIGDEERLRLENEAQSARMWRMQDERDAEIAGLRRTVAELARRMEVLVGGAAGAGGEDRPGNGAS